MFFVGHDMKLPEQLLNAMDSARQSLATSDDGNKSGQRWGRWKNEEASAYERAMDYVVERGLPCRVRN